MYCLVLENVVTLNVDMACENLCKLVTDFKEMLQVFFFIVIDLCQGHYNVIKTW